MEIYFSDFHPTFEETTLSVVNPAPLHSTMSPEKLLKHVSVVDTHIILLEEIVENIVRIRAKLNIDET